jgi:hypothetical protein
MTPMNADFAFHVCGHRRNLRLLSDFATVQRLAVFPRAVFSSAAPVALPRTAIFAALPRIAGRPSIL